MSGPMVMMLIGTGMIVLGVVLAIAREVTTHRCKWVETFYQAPTYEEHGQKIEGCACGAVKGSWRKLGGDWNLHMERHPSPVLPSPGDEE